MKKLSLIIPVYNAQTYLEKCLDSIIDQTYKNMEILLIDDGSKDESGRICDLYAEKDERIKVIHQKNQGVSSARNQGLDCASGEYITFVDADDWVSSKEHYEDCIKKLEDSKADVLYYGMIRTIWRKGKSKSEKRGVPQITGCLSRDEMRDYVTNRKGEIRGNVFSYIFTPKVIDKERFDQSMAYAEDEVFVLRVLSNADVYYFSENCNYQYNVRDGSAAFRWQPKMVECQRKSLKEIANFYKSLKIDNEDIKKLMSVQIINAYASLIYNLCLPTCTLRLKDKMKITRLARKEFKIDTYKKYYHVDKKSLFERVKTRLTFYHLEWILIFVGPLYCKRGE